jgi:hypothetical protein
MAIYPRCSTTSRSSTSTKPRLRYTTAATKMFRFFWFWMLKTNPNQTKQVRFEPVLGSVWVILTRTIIFRFGWIFGLKPNRTGPWTPLVRIRLWGKWLAEHMYMYYKFVWEHEFHNMKVEKNIEIVWIIVNLYGYCIYYDKKEKNQICKCFC